MARPRTPTAILEARGSFLPGANPARRRINEPKPSKPLGRPPAYLNETERAVWTEIAKRLPAGVAMEPDRDAFELLTRLTVKMRNGELGSEGRSTIITLWARFGMTPSDRARLSIEPPKASNLDKFLHRKSAPALIPIRPEEIPNP
jgi:phage terminase small subunit